MAVIGLDLGTTSCKAIAYSRDGRMLAQAGRKNALYRRGEECEIDAREVWESVRGALCQCARDAGEPIEGIGVSSFGESFVALDAQDEVIARSMLYTDPRGSDETGVMEDYTRVTRLKPHSTFTLPKLLWFKAHRPTEFEAARRFLLFEDFIIYRLTGEACISYSMAARTGMLDIETKRYHPPLLEAAGIDEGKLSRPVAPGTVCGRVRGIDGLAGAIVVAGGQDQVCAAIGAGLTREGDALCGLGTVECATPVFEGMRIDEEMVRQGFCCLPYVGEDRYVTFAYHYTGGSSIEWFMNRLADNGVESPYAHYEREAAKARNDLLVLPHFSGAATPYMDNDARAAIVGMDLNTTRTDIYRALLEGCGYELRINLERLAEKGIPVNRLVACGGGAASALWLQMQADIFRVPIWTLQNPEAGTMGGALLSAVALGWFDGLAQAARAWIAYGRCYTPNAAMDEYYEGKYARYRRLYGALKQV